MMTSQFDCLFGDILIFGCCRLPKNSALHAGDFLTGRLTLSKREPVKKKVRLYMCMSVSCTI